MRRRRLNNVSWRGSALRLTLNRASSTTTAPDAFWHVGDVSVPLYHPQHPQRVPIAGGIAASQGYLKANDARVLAYMRWMAQKDILGQDMCLCGPPDCARRWIALQYCAFTRREVYTVSLSRDTTEADLKQRREIREGTLHYESQAAVCAALRGQMLLLEGLERAERNVLPILNNLLENREMNLDDGRMLVHPTRYDELLARHGEDLLHRMGLLRVHERFRVIALAAARYPGSIQALDPPLRSRFQCLYVHPPDVQAVWQQVCLTASLAGVQPNEAPHAERLKMLTKFWETLRHIGTAADSVASGASITSSAAGTMGPVELDAVVREAVMFPLEPLSDILTRVLRIEPSSASREDRNAIDRGEAEMKKLLHRCGAGHAGRNASVYVPCSIKQNKEGSCLLEFSDGLTVPTPVGPALRNTAVAGRSVEVPSLPGHHFAAYHHTVFRHLIQSHCAGRHILLLGPAGCGKTAIVRELAAALGYEGNGTETVHLFSDMTPRDLLQRRATDPVSGATTWEHSGLLSAAQAGKLVILDGVEQLAPGTLAVLESLLVDGFAALYDGTVFRSPAAYDALTQALGGSSAGEAESLAATVQGHGVIRIHPDFRVIATARSHGRNPKWITPDITAVFDVHAMTHMPAADVIYAIEAAAVEAARTHSFYSSTDCMGPREIKDTAAKLVKLRDALAEASSPNVPQLTLRQMIRIVKYAALFPGELKECITSNLLLSLATPHVADIVRTALDRIFCDPPSAPSRSIPQAIMGALRGPPSTPEPPSLVISPAGTSDGQRALSVNGRVIMNVDATRLSPEERSLIPHVTSYFDNKRHAQVAGWLLKQLVLGLPILLVGNQGVGKNKITDHTLATAALPRQYVQLHRDTTVASLTVTMSVVNGKIQWEDSPLVKAAAQGHVLVIDEIDKAPVEVVQILKGLIEDRELRLIDGRLITARGGESTPSTTIVPLHPNFRVIVLANPPGFPFHGNNFYRECGDLFSSYVLSNPDASSLFALLRQYAPSVPAGTIVQLVALFTALSDEWAAGRVQYPFSTRELIAVVKHLQAFPTDGVYQALNNVFMFDASDPTTMDTVRRLIHKHIRRRGAAELRFGAAAESPLSTVTAASSSFQLYVEDAGIVPVALRHMETLASSLLILRPGAGCATKLNMPMAWINATVAVDDNLDTLRPASCDVVDEILATFQLSQLFERTVDVLSRTYPTVKNVAVPRVVNILTLSGTSVVVLHCVASHSDGTYHSLITFPNPVPSVGSGTCPISTGKAVVIVVDVGDPKLTQGPVELLAPNGGTTGSVMLANAATNRFLLVDPITGQGSLTCIPHDVFGDATATMNTKGASVTGTVMLSSPSCPHVAIWDGGDLRIFRAAVDDRVVLRCSVIRESLYHVVMASAGASTGAAHFIVQTPRQADDSSRLPTEAQLWRLLSDQPGVLSHDADVEFLPSPSAGATTSSETESLRFTALERSKNAVVSVSWTPGAASMSAQRTVLSKESVDMSRAEYDPASQQLASPTPQGLSVVDLGRGRARHITTLGPGHLKSLGSGAALSEDGVSGKLFDTMPQRLKERFDAWTNAAKEDGSVLGAPPTPRELKTWYSTPKKQPSGALKHGKEDNQPHHGGNTFAGGTGGTDTAGLGGIIGPYRLDKGWDVHQVDPALKQQVPKHLVDEAKRMGREALAEKLKEIGMHPQQFEQYMELYASVKDPIAQLKLILQGLKSRTQERVWVRHQTDGIWDDSKIVEGITGDKAIFKRRVDPEDHHAPATRPEDRRNGSKAKKRLLFLFDVSASMYRFNGNDQRLQRLMECAVLICEAFEGCSDIIDYSIVGHNGDSSAIPLVPWGAPPVNRMERYKLCLSLIAHAQHCWTGDSTLQAVSMGIDNVLAGDEADDRFVFLISDANLQQYGYTPSDFCKLITQNPLVQVYCLFIASFGAQSQRLQQQLPRGHAFDCMDTKELPHILKRIFVAANILTP